MTKMLGLDFMLMGLTLDRKDSDLAARFAPLIRQNERSRFRRWTWEGLHEDIANISGPYEEKELVLHYFANKTIGYDGRRILRKAFSVTDAGCK